jgi:GNAT superfamily N-acetyltransferase
VDRDVKTPVAADPLPGLRVHRFDNPPYYKYFFTRDVFSPGVAGQIDTEAENPLPTGYRYHDRRGRIGVLPYQLDLVQSRTHIPRPRRQLESIPSVAIYQGNGSLSDENQDENEMPIAWAFLGVDGAVATLHVEPEHRGRGLALSLSKEVMRRGMEAEGVFGAKKVGLVDGEMRTFVEDWVHAEVAGYNKASRRVMEKIGGKVLTTVLWTVIEVTD